MQKAFIIALGALVIAGGIIALALAMRESQVEYHIRGYKREYLAASYGGARPNLVKSTLGWFVGFDHAVLQSEERARAAERAESHRAALVKLGYFIERRFVITNRDFNEVLGATLSDRSQLSRSQPPWAVRESVAQTNVLVVTGLPEIVSQYDELIRKADVPQRGK